MSTNRLLLTLPLLALPVVLAGQGPAPTTAPAPSVDPARLTKPLGEDWPTYSGDYTGKRYSPLTQVDRTTVKGLSLAWTARLTAGSGAGGGRGRFGGGGAKARHECRRRGIRWR